MTTPPPLRLQPIIHVGSGRPLSFEVLAGAEQAPHWDEKAWMHWYLTMGHWMPEILRKTREAAPSGVCVFVNLNSHQAANPAIVRAINALLAEHGPRIGLEWTEDLSSCLDYRTAVQQFRDWRASGVSIAVDDVGDGHDGIGRCLAVLPQYAKFSSRLMTAERESCASILGPARKMFEGLQCEVIAEGVEDSADLEMARRAGLQYAQGWAFGKPAEFKLTEDRDFHPGSFLRGSSEHAFF